MGFTDIEGSFPSLLLVFSIAIATVVLLKSLIPKPKVDIKGKYILITGCDSGFGRETAIRLDEMGVCVLATCLTKEGEQSLKSVASERLTTFQMDVTNSQQIQDVFKKVKELVGANKGKVWAKLVKSTQYLSFKLNRFWCYLTLSLLTVQSPKLIHFPKLQTA